MYFLFLFFLLRRLILSNILDKGFQHFRYKFYFQAFITGKTLCKIVVQEVTFGGGGKEIFLLKYVQKKKILTEFIFERKSEEKKKKKKRNYKISFNLIAKEYVIVKWRGGGIHNYLFMFENGFLF